MFEQFTAPPRPRAERIGQGLQLSSLLLMVIAMYPSSTGRAHHPGLGNVYGVCFVTSILLMTLRMAMFVAARKQHRSGQSVSR